MFGLLLFLGVIVILFWTVPVAHDILACYDRSRETFDDVEVRSRVRGWEKEYRCELRQGTIASLENCIETRFDEPGTPIFLKLQLLRLLEAVRPDVLSIINLKKDHNNDCREYPDTHFIIKDDNNILETE
jgi:hypothetical protein